jgi:hypothetical protein
MIQLRLSKNLGADTHVRDHTLNKFQNQNHNTFGMIIGEVQAPEPEPLYRQNMVTVSLARGGKITSVAYPGAFAEPTTGNIHGVYEGPIPGQMVIIGFENGNQATPFVINKYPYQGKGNTALESGYITPLFKAGFHSTDVIMGHVSGAYISLNTGIAPSVYLPGSITIKSMTGIDIIASGKTLINSDTEIEFLTTGPAKVNGATVELNGNTNFAVKYTELKTAFDLLKTELNSFITIFNAHVHVVTTPDTINGTAAPTVTPGVAATADIAASKNDKVLM